MTERSVLYSNGNIYTMDDKLSKADYFIVHNNKIKEVGRQAELDHSTKNQYEIINLDGKTVLPGFTDCHLHLIAYSSKKENSVDLKDVTSEKELIEKVKSFIELKNIKPGEWVYGEGWNQEKFNDKKMPDKNTLDRISMNHPILLTRCCYHICVVNRIILNLAKIDEHTLDPIGGSIDKGTDGIPTGILKEKAMNLIEEPGLYDKEKMKKLILIGCGDLVKVGVTTAHTDDFPFVADKKALLDAFMELAKSDQLPIRLVLQLRATSVEDIEWYTSMGLKSGTKFGNLIVGPIKIIEDGSLGSSTAALNEPYTDGSHNKGILIIPEKELDMLIHESLQSDFDIAIHAIGDRTMDIILNIYEKYENLYKLKGLRPSIVHCQIASKEILERFKRLGVIANIQPIFLNSDWVMAENRVGKERMEYSYCWRKFIEDGILCVGSSDCPVESFNPIYGIYAAVARKDLNKKPQEGWYSSEAIDTNTAIKLFTVNPPYLIRDEDINGSIMNGKLADFIVLSEDLQAVSTERYLGIKVLKTFVGGKEV